MTYKSENYLYSPFHNYDYIVISQMIEARNMHQHYTLVKIHA